MCKTEPEHNVNLFLSGNFYSHEDLEFRECSTKLIPLAKDCVVFREADCSPSKAIILLTSVITPEKKDLLPPEGFKTEQDLLYL